MRVYVDQIDCTGSGQCEQMVPEVFMIEDSGLATVRGADGAPLPEGGAGLGADVPDSLRAGVLDMVDMCPGACIHCQED
jgi:ferredoxin